MVIMKLKNNRILFLLGLIIFLLGGAIGIGIYHFRASSTSRIILTKMDNDGQVEYIAKEQEPNNTFDKATSIVPGYETMGTFGSGKDIDIYMFNIDAPATIKTTLRNIPSSYELAFYDQNKQEIASSKRSGFIQSA